MPLHTILSSDTALLRALALVLCQHNQNIRTIGSGPLLLEGSDNRIADLLDYEALVTAVAGSDYVYLLTNLSYHSPKRQDLWPSFMRNSINACKETCAKLIFLDNAHMYGKVTGLVTEQTPYRPIGANAKIRAHVAFMLQQEMAEGKIRALIARTADVYGPGINEPYTTGMQVFEPLSKGKAPWAWQNTDVPRSLAFLPDVARFLYLLAGEEKALGQVWHLPAGNAPLTLSEMATIAASCMHSKLQLIKRPAWIYAICRRLDASLAERHEQIDLENYPFHFDSSKFEKVFQTMATPNREAIQNTANWFLKHR